MESNVAQLAIHEQLLAWFETHKKQVLWAALGVIVAAIGAGFFAWRHNETETNASQALSRAGASVGDPAATTAALLKVATDYPGTDAGARALLLGGGILFAQGKYPEARGQFEQYLRTYRENSLAGQALLGIAICLDVQGQTNEAVAAYRDIIEHHPNDYVVPQAKFALAQIYETQKKLEQARDLYLNLARPGLYDSIATGAGMRLKELIAAHPELAPVRPAFGTNTPSIKLQKP